MNVKNIRKVLTIVSLSSLAITCLFLITGIFVHEIFKNPLLNILLIFAIFTVAPAIALTEVNVLLKKRTIGIVSLSLLALSTLLAIIMVIIPSLTNFNFYGKITLTISIISVVFAMILSNYTKLEKRALVLQIVTYSLLSILGILIILQVYGLPLLQNFWQIFLILVIVNIGLLIAIAVISKKSDDAKLEVKSNIKTIIVSQELYDNLIAENEKLKIENENLKTKLEELKK